MPPLVKPRPARRRRGSLSRQQVVEAALQLADQDGLEALSMLTLARRLECGVMTIYGYVDNKQDLLDAIALRGLADVRMPRPLPRQPRAVLIAWGRALRQTLLEHPSLPVIFLSQAVIGPGIFRGVEALLGALTRAGMPANFGVHAIYAAVIYSAGFVAWELPRTRRQPQAVYAAAWRREFAGLRQEDFPLTARVLEELPHVAGEQQFEIGLAALADGLVIAAAA
jgi:TetR/AcrR family transcriptional regulator, tetracycline repressor protein